jgi:hypothetical protein
VHSSAGSQMQASKQVETKRPPALNTLTQQRHY